MSNPGGRGPTRSPHLAREPAGATSRGVAAFEAPVEDEESARGVYPWRNEGTAAVVVLSLIGMALTALLEIELVKALLQGL